jgi:hypothetical protein
MATWLYGYFAFCESFKTSNQVYGLVYLVRWIGIREVEVIARKRFIAVSYWDIFQEHVKKSPVIKTPG